MDLNKAIAAVDESKSGKRVRFDWKIGQVLRKRYARQVMKVGQILRIQRQCERITRKNMMRICFKIFTKIFW